jgi:hypothetical protein
MKAYVIISMLMISLIIVILPIFPQQEHPKIVEEVSVKWWQVPVFALDKSGNPVTDLEPGDIQVQLNGRHIPGKNKTAVKAKKSRQAISAEEMKHILQGAADYCQRLKQSVFHFYCREKIVETRMPLSRIDKTKIQIKSYLFGYRLIKQGNQIREERDWISSWDKKKVNRDQVVNTNSFFSVKAVFAPITILDRTRQDKYNFQFIRFDERKGRRMAVIEALPKKPLETGTLYGTLWIDMEDFSLLKIEAGPKSIIGYWQLQKLADKLNTRLHLFLEIDFKYHRKGIRFLTKVSFLERYKGGRNVSWHRGQDGWIRTRTRFTYSDYRFFSVQTDVTVQKAVVNKQ